MPSAQRRRRGWETQEAVAAWFRYHGWPFAQSTGAGRSGTDVTGLPGLSVEVKGRRDFDPLAWIRQAAKRDLPSFAVWRPDGMGPKSVAGWPVMMTLETLTGLLQDAGYGDKNAMLASYSEQAGELLASALRDIEAGRG